MVDIGVAEWCLPSKGLHSIAYAAQRGVCSLHLGVATASDVANLSNESWLERLSLASTHHGVRVTCLALNCVERFGSLQRRRAANLPFCRYAAHAALAAAQRLAIPLVYIPSFGKSEIRSRRDLDDAVVYLRSVCEAAAGTQIVVASENSLDAAGNNWLFDQVGSENFKILFDVYNPVRWGHAPASMVETLWGRLADQVHVKDGIHGGYGNVDLGAGDGRVRSTVAALRDRGFAGSLILENDYRSDDEALLKDVRCLREMFGEVGTH